MIENLVEITSDQLLGEVSKAKYDGYRFVTASCADNGDDTIDIIYHFDKDYGMLNFKVTVKKGEEVPSISKIIFTALLVENEMKELFGLNITGIVVDYGGHMLLSEEELGSPFLRRQITIEQRGGKQL
ncbi:MAG: NADH:ubiquinone oxidoreductase 27 kD subunit [Eubacterium sp.]|jgi:Ni,Fe-hydrogenase III component G|nr:NADH:ubiquinone oxidoreductase 27 kD subunit [Eubacterium sp.]